MHEIINAMDVVNYDLSKHYNKMNDFISKARAVTNVLGN